MADIDEDVNIVDLEDLDVGEPALPPSTRQAGPAPETNAAGRPMRASALRAAARRRSSSPLGAASADRSTRSSKGGGLKLQPKLKLKLSDKAAAMASGTSFLGSYDRELDSDDEDLSFEEQFILRMPPGEDCEKIRKMVSSREISNDVWFKFKDARRAIFHVGNSSYSAKLVDLPSIIECQKTLDNKQMFKVADICQMLLVEDRIESEDSLGNRQAFNIDEFIYPHGITPPLHHVRKRRFRKRVNRSTIETVEQEVERLLEADAMATRVQYDVLENVNPELSDSEFIEQEVAAEAPTPGPVGSDAGDALTPAPGGDDLGEDDEEEQGDGDIDEDLAAELDLALDEAENEEDEGEEDDESDDEDEDEDEDDDDSQSKRLLNEEIRDLQAAVAKKEHEIASSANPLIRRRFEDTLKKLQADLEMKIAQRDELNEQRAMRKAGIVPQRAESEAIDDLLDEIMDTVE